MAALDPVNSAKEIMTIKNNMYNIKMAELDGKF